MAIARTLAPAPAVDPLRRAAGEPRPGTSDGPPASDPDACAEIRRSTLVYVTHDAERGDGARRRDRRAASRPHRGPGSARRDCTGSLARLAVARALGPVMRAAGQCHGQRRSHAARRRGRGPAPAGRPVARPGPAGAGDARRAGTPAGSWPSGRVPAPGSSPPTSAERSSRARAGSASRSETGWGCERGGTRRGRRGGGERRARCWTITCAVPHSGSSSCRSSRACGPGGGSGGGARTRGRGARNSARRRACPMPDGADFRTAAQCGACHTEIYAEWKESMHGQAMSDRLFLELAPENKEECIRCHAPVPLRDVDFDTPIARLDRREDAVSCLTCHQAGENMAGPHEGLTGACRPIHDPRPDQRREDVLRLPQPARHRHRVAERPVRSQRAPSRASKPETNCLDCHMPEVERPLVAGGPRATGRRHTWPGGHTLRADPEGREARSRRSRPLEGGGFRFRVWVTNVGAGHNIPTDARHRSFDTYVKLWDAEGKVDPRSPRLRPAGPGARPRRTGSSIGTRDVRDTQIAPLARVSGIEAEKGYVDVPERHVRTRRGMAGVSPDAGATCSRRRASAHPETFAYYRARVVDARGVHLRTVTDASPTRPSAPASDAARRRSAGCGTPGRNVPVELAAAPKPLESRLVGPRGGPSALGRPGREPRAPSGG